MKRLALNFLMFHRPAAAANGLNTKEKGPACRTLIKDGGARRDRTADLYNAIVALSQLSYGPVLLAEGRAFRHSNRGLST